MEIKVVFSEYPDLEKLDRLDKFLAREYLVARWGNTADQRKVHYYTQVFDLVASRDIQLNFERRR